MHRIKGAKEQTDFHFSLIGDKERCRYYFFQIANREWSIIFQLQTIISVYQLQNLLTFFVHAIRPFPDYRLQ